VNGWADITDYGAVEGHDSTTGIRDAITALGAAGGVVYFPPGRYLVTDLIQVPSNITLRGCGMGVTVVEQPATATAGLEVFLIGKLFDLPVTSGVTVADMTIKFDSRPSGSGLGGAGIYLINTQETRVTNVSVEHGDLGLYVDGGAYDTAVGACIGVYCSRLQTLVTNGGNAGVYVDGGASANDLDTGNRSLHFTNSDLGSRGDSVGVHLINCRDVFLANTSSQDSMVDLKIEPNEGAVSSASVNRVQALNATFDVAGQNTASISAASGCTVFDLMFANGFFGKTSGMSEGDSILVDGSTGNVSGIAIGGHQIQLANGTSSNGINIEHCTHVNITACISLKNGLAGVSMTDVSDVICAFTCCTAIDFTGGPTANQHYGLEIAGTNTAVQVFGCDFGNNITGPVNVISTESELHGVVIESNVGVPIGYTAAPSMAGAIQNPYNMPATVSFSGESDYSALTALSIGPSMTDLISIAATVIEVAQIRLGANQYMEWSGPAIEGWTWFLG
jgi:Pectate lyase superfamily protein